MKFVPSRKTTNIVFDIQRRVVANKTLEGWREAPHAAVQLDLDVDAVLEWLRAARENPAYTGVRLTLNAVMLKLIAEALRFAPHLNAHISYSPLASVGSVTCFEEVNIAVPFRSTDSRTITPVVRDVAAKSLAAVCASMEDLARRAANTNVDLLLRKAAVGDTVRRLLMFDPRVLWRIYANFIGPRRLPKVSPEEKHRWDATPPEDRLTPENLFSATVLVSNIGSTTPRNCPISVPLIDLIEPQTTAIGLGSIRRQPVARMVDGEERVVVRSILPMTIIADHRALDLEHALPYIEKITEYCLNPAQALG
jgi:pyruvate dehydrogenase E2 component (dihydrolipoamide acetyltransferase)